MRDEAYKREIWDGYCDRAYEYLGCNLSVVNGIYRYSFRVWAPNARAVALVSDFSGWDSPYPMRRITQGGVYECYFDSPVSLEKKAYKFKITASDGRIIIKGDPYARFSRGGADGASLIFTYNSFKWEDKAVL